jgi:hypothetical protein
MDSKGETPSLHGLLRLFAPSQLSQRGRIRDWKLLVVNNPVSRSPTPKLRCQVRGCVLCPVTAEVPKIYFYLKKKIEVPKIAPVLSI